MKPSQQSQQGMALVAALFLIVVLAGLGVAALRLYVSQQHADTLHLQGTRAQAAAQAGLEFGANRALRAGTCAAVTNLNLNQAALNGFRVRVNCVRTNHVVNGTGYWVYDLDAQAWLGAYGSPDYVSRSVQRRVDAIP